MTTTQQHSGRSHSHSHPSAHEQPAAPPPRRRHWGRRLFVLLLLLAGAAAGAYFYKFGPLIFSEPYKLAIEDLKVSPTVAKMLGEPIRADWIPRPSGEVSANGDQGEARLMLNVVGPKGSAVATVKARRLEGKWGFNEFQVKPDGGEAVSLMEEINKRDGVDTPEYDPYAVQTPPKTTESTPDQDIKIEIPPIPGGK